MEENRYIQMLEHHGVKPTANRLLIVRTLAREHHPVTMKELEDELLTLDKSSIFRVLSLFREHRLVHVVEGGDGAVRYELCQSRHEDEDEDEHVHFYCERCHRTICLHDVPVPQIQVPEGMEVRSTGVLVRGVCEDCLRRQSAAS
jgi:Fur family ferric uptake transcriptional regulator